MKKAANIAIGKWQYNMWWRLPFVGQEIEIQPFRDIQVTGSRRIYDTIIDEKDARNVSCMCPGCFCSACESNMIRNAIVVPTTLAMLSTMGK